MEKLPEVRDAFAALARAIQRMGVHRHAREQHIADLQPALLTLATVLMREPTLTVQVEPGTFVCDGAVVYREVARESSLCQRLHRDGVRSLTFTRGVTLEELLAFVLVGLPETAGREDAVTELWKAGLQNVSYTVVPGDQLDDAGGASGIAGRARGILERFADPLSAEEETAARLAPPLLGEVERRRIETESWSALAQRAAATLLDIVAHNFAGRDLPSLEETFGRLLDEMLERREPEALLLALEQAHELQGTHGAGFRAGLGQRLSDKQRVHRALELARGAQAVLPALLAMLPPAAGEVLLDALDGEEGPQGRALLAQAVAQRLDSCRKHCEQKLRFGAPEVAGALLAALAPLPGGAQLAALALQHRSAPVRLLALKQVGGAPGAEVAPLGPLLSDSDPRVRVAAAEALGGCAAAADASRLLLATVGREQFALEDRALQLALYRALGRLRDPAGFTFLLERLAGTKRALLRKKNVEDQQVLAVHGLAADASERSLAALEEAAESGTNAPPVILACREAALRLRKQLGRART